MRDSHAVPRQKRRLGHPMQFAAKVQMLARRSVDFGNTGRANKRFGSVEMRKWMIRTKTRSIYCWTESGTLSERKSRPQTASVTTMSRNGCSPLKKPPQFSVKMSVGFIAMQPNSHLRAVSVEKICGFQRLVYAGG